MNPEEHNNPVLFVNEVLNLDFEHTIQSFHKTFWLMMMYNQTKLGCKRISSSIDMIETVLILIP